MIEPPSDLGWNLDKLYERLEFWIDARHPERDQVEAVIEWFLRDLAVDPYRANARPFPGFPLNFLAAEVPVALTIRGQRLVVIVSLNHTEGIMTVVTLDQITAPTWLDMAQDTDEDFDPYE